MQPLTTIEFKGRAKVDRWLLRLKAERKAPSTRRKHEIHVSLFLRFAQKEPEEVGMDNIECWRIEMSVNRHYDTWTLVHNFLSVRKFMRYIGREDFAAKMEVPRKPRHIAPEKEIWLLPEEREALLKKAAIMGVRTLAIVRLLDSSGIRSGELCAIDIPDIDFQEQTIKIRHGKGDKPRTVFFDTETKKAILEYLTVRIPTKDGTPALFTSQQGKRLSYNIVNVRVKEAAVLAGIDKKITPHKIRHTFITRVIETTKDIPLAQKLAGHDDITTTMRYHHQTPDEIKAKYITMLDSPRAREVMPKPLSREEILQALDSKYLKGEIPVEIYTQVRKGYEGNIAVPGDGKPKDPAYG